MGFVDVVTFSAPPASNFSRDALCLGWWLGCREFLSFLLHSQLSVFSACLHLKEGVQVTRFPLGASLGLVDKNILFPDPALILGRSCVLGSWGWGFLRDPAHLPVAAKFCLVTGGSCEGESFLFLYQQKISKDIRIGFWAQNGFLLTPLRGRLLFFLPLRHLQ